MDSIQDSTNSIKTRASSIQNDTDSTSPQNNDHSIQNDGDSI